MKAATLYPDLFSFSAPVRASSRRRRFAATANPDRQPSAFAQLEREHAASGRLEAAVYAALAFVAVAVPVWQCFSQAAAL